MAKNSSLASKRNLRGNNRAVAIESPDQLAHDVDGLTLCPRAFERGWFLGVEGVHPDVQRDDGGAPAGGGAILLGKTHTTLILRL